LIPASADFEISCWYFPGTSTHGIFSAGINNSTGRFSAFHNAPGQVTISLPNTSSFNVVSGLVAGVWNYIRFTRVATTYTFIGNNTGSATSATNITAANTRLLQVANVFHSNGRISDFRITTGGITTYFPLTDGSGASLAWYQSDGTSGVVSNALQGTLTNVWANKTNGVIVPPTKYSQRAIIPRDTKWNRVSAAGDDRFFATAAAITGGDKTNAEAYLI
jgi:hypothetical protein